MFVLLFLGAATGGMGEGLFEGSSLGVGQLGVPFIVNHRPRVVPLRNMGSSYRPTPLGKIVLCVDDIFRVLCVFYS